MQKWDLDEDLLFGLVWLKTSYQAVDLNREQFSTTEKV